MRAYHHRLNRTIDPGHLPRRDELKHAQPDAREAKDHASDQFDHTVPIGGLKRSLQRLLPKESLSVGYGRGGIPPPTPTTRRSRQAVALASPSPAGACANLPI